MIIKTNKNKLIVGLKILFVVIILGITAKESANIIRGFNIETFYTYADQLTLGNILIIISLGIISYIPLTFYDFIIKKRVGINLDNKKLYKYSWIASSVSSIVGFGGSSAIALKSYFYNQYVKDKKHLAKEVSKVVALNLTGFSITCFIYLIIMNFNLGKVSITNVLTICISMYLPVLTLILVGRYIKYKNELRRDVIDTFKIIGISLLEWITTITLVYSIVIILGENISIAQFFPIFVAAIAVAIISMSPGGVGTFDLTLLTGLNALGVASEKVILAIFLYRLTYYIIPLLIGVVLYISEFWTKVDKNKKYVVSIVSSKFAHYGLIVLVFSAGLLLLASQAIPGMLEKIYVVNQILGFKITCMSGGISIIIGFLLIAMSSVINFKSKNVYKITMALVVIGTFISLIIRFEYQVSLYLIIVGVVLKISKNQFYRDGFVMRWGDILKNTLILLFFQGLYIYVAHNNTHLKVSSNSIFNLSNYYTFGQVRKLGAISTIGFLIALVFLVILYYLNKKNDFKKVKLYQCEDKVYNILKKYNGSSVSHFVNLNDKFVYMNKDEDVMLQYQVYVNKLVVLGNLVGDDNKFFESIQEFYEMSDRYGYIPVFTAIDESMIPHLHETGYEFIKLGEEASVNLQEFTLEGRKMKSVRNALSRVEKEGYTFEMVYPPFSNNFLKEIKNISDEWLEGREEKGFSVGFFDEEYLSLDAIAIVKNKDDEIKGFTNLMPMYDGNKTLSIDLMRFSKDSCNGIMDFIFVNLFKYGIEHGYERFNMGMAPLSNVGRSKYSFLREKMAAKVYFHGQYFYSFEGLKRFKEKYCDFWDGRYMAYKKRTSLVFTMIQVIMLVSNGKKYRYESFNNEREPSKEELA